MVNEKFIDKDIYARAKRKVDMEHKKHSAYKSMAITKEYKRLGGKIKGGSKTGGTSKWIKEDWRNLTPYATGQVKSIRDTPKCGNKGKNQKAPSICRPIKEAVKYTKGQLKKAVEIKKKGETINWKKL